MEAKEIQTDNAKKVYYIFYLVLSIAWAFLATFFNAKVTSGFFMKLIGALGGSLGGFLGFILADFIRKLAVPDLIFTSGGFFALLRARLFWMCGPQLIGIVIGGALVASLIVEMK